MNAPIPSIIFDEHASVLAHWSDSGYQGRTVVCFDAHLDLQFISRRRIDLLRSASSTQAVAELAKPHHLVPDSWANGRTFSYGIEDFFYAASQIGIVNHLVWVVPPYVLSRGVGGAIEQLQQVDGVTLQDLESFRRLRPASEPMCWIEGELLGVKLTVCDEAALGMIPLPSDSIVDIDIDYFVELPNEQIGVDPVQSVALVRSLDIDLKEVTISRSVLSGFTPMAYYRLAELIRELFDVSSSENASTWPLRLLAGDEDQDPLRLACEALARGKDITVNAIENLLSMVAEQEPLPGLLWSATGLLWCHHGQSCRAQEAYRQAKESLGPHPELALELGKMFAKTDEYDTALDYLHDALRDDKTNTSAKLEIAVVFMRQSLRVSDASSISTKNALLDSAIEHLQSASLQSPAWEVPWSLLGQCYALLGDQDSAQHHTNVASEIRSRVSRCVQEIQ